MVVRDKKIELEEKDYKNKFKKLKRYLDKDYKIISKGKDEETQVFIKAFNQKDLRKRYEIIYDYMCDYLDKNVCVVCDFKNNKCIGNRMGTSVHKENGCCYFRNEGFCKLFKNKKCTNPNISCKLFMCPLAEKKMGFHSLPKNYFLLKYYFNFVQRDILRYSYRKPKKDCIEDLLRKK